MQSNFFKKIRLFLFKKKKKKSEFNPYYTIELQNAMYKLQTSAALENLKKMMDIPQVVLAKTNQNQVIIS